MASLYEIDQSIRDAIENGFTVDEATGEILDGAELLESLAADRSAKLENTALYIKNLAADAAAIKAEEQALHERRTVMEKKADRLKEYISASMKSNGESKFETPRCVLFFRKSAAVEVPDEVSFIGLVKAAGQMQYLTIKDPAINKAAIKDALKAGTFVPGANLVEHQNLQIK